MKRIFSLLLIMFIMLSSMTVFAENDTEAMLEKIATLTKEERAQYISLARPFFTSDAGVSAALDNINAGVFSSMFGDLFGENVENDYLKRIFLSVKCIKEETGIRLKYADIIQEKIPMAISSETKQGIGILLEHTYKKSPEIKRAFTEDGYTEEVVANILTMFPQINGGHILAYEDGFFSPDNLNGELSRDFNNVWKGYKKPITAENVVLKFADSFNAVPKSERTALAKSLQALNVCEIKNTPATPPATPPTTEITKTEYYEVIKSAQGVSDDIFKNSLVIKTTQSVPKVLDVELKSENPLVKKLDKDNFLNIITFSIPTENGVRFVAEPNTIYVITAHPYPFVDANGWGKKYIAALNARGIINGKSETEFMPEDKITREEFTKLVVALLGILDENAKSDFTDVNDNAWYAPFVASAKAKGIISGLGDGTFGVGKNITRQDMAKIIGTVLDSYDIVSTQVYFEFNDSDEIASYAEGYVQKLANLGIISGDDNKNFNPKNFATRQEAAKMIFGMLNCCILHN